MATLNMLPDDLLVEIMLRGDSLQDLRSTALATRATGFAFLGRRTLLVRAVLRNELALRQRTTVSFSAYQHVNEIVNRLHHDHKAEKSSATQDAIMFLEAVEPYVDHAMFGPIYMAWTLKICQLYTHAGEHTDMRRLELLERAYRGMLGTCDSIFDPEVDTRSSANVGPLATSHRVSRAARSVALELDRVYSSQGRLMHSLELEKNVFRRLTLKSPESTEWGCRILNTLRKMDMQSEALQFASNLHAICRANGWRDSALTWARHLVSEHCLAGNATEALHQQRLLLNQLRRGSDEYIAWGRQLIVMQKRAGLVHEAVATKQEVWQSMNFKSTCYFGWAHELADDYRKLNRFQEAVAVMETLHEQSQARLACGRINDEVSFHANNSARALASELESCGRKNEALSIRTKFCA